MKTMIWQLFVVLAVLFMGFNSFIAKILVKTIKPIIVMLYQFMIAAPLVFSYLIINNWDYSFNPWLLLIGIGYFASLTLFYTSLVKGSLTRSGPIWGLNLIVTAILGFIFLKEALDWKIFTGLTFGVLSIYFLRSDK
jgi:drug/metabolite transporter (DMT)-like permease